jgi:hypothetical protein
MRYGLSNQRRRIRHGVHILDCRRKRVNDGRRLLRPSHIPTLEIVRRRTEPHHQVNESPLLRPVGEWGGVCARITNAAKSRPTRNATSDSSREHLIVIVLFRLHVETATAVPVDSRPPTDSRIQTVFERRALWITSRR